ncbi:CofH family radical SAM protein [Thermoproteota archaeon]
MVSDMRILSRLLRDSEVYSILEKALHGDKLMLQDIKNLMKSQDTHLIGLVADKIRKEIVGDTVTFIPNQILNYTNICTVRCDFCAFYRNKGSKDSYTLTPSQVIDRAVKAWSQYNTRQVLIQGGVNPELTIEYYEEIFRGIKEKTENLAIHGLSTSEIEFISKKEKMSIREVLQRLQNSGLDSIPGAGGEILVDRIREKMRRRLSSADGWLRVMEEAHNLSIPTSATMMYGHIESDTDRAEHIHKIRELQEKSGGFMAFIGWNFEPGSTKLERDGLVTRSVGGRELLRIVAAARIVFRELIPNIQSSWLTNSIPIAQIALVYGANDWGGTLYDEEVIPATGKQVRDLKIQDIVYSVKNINRQVAERDNFYKIVRYL